MGYISHQRKNDLRQYPSQHTVAGHHRPTVETSFPVGRWCPTCMFTGIIESTGHVIATFINCCCFLFYVQLLSHAWRLPYLGVTHESGLQYKHNVRILKNVTFRPWLIQMSLCQGPGQLVRANLMLPGVRVWA